MKKIFPFVFSLLAITGFVACNTLKVTTDYNSSVDFTKYKTFNFYEITDAGESISELNKDRFIKAIKAELAKKGFVSTETNPDMWVRATTVLTSKRTVTATTNYYGYGGYYRPYYYGPGYAGASTTYHEGQYTDGSVIIDILDGTSKSLVWTGTGNKEIDKPQGSDERIKGAVEQILESFPPKKK